MKALVEKLKLSKIPEKSWTHLTVDFITKLPLVAGKDVILVVCNRLLYRLSESMVLDRGLQFIVKLTNELNRMLGIETKLLTAFHLQTNEQTKQMNQKLE